MFRHQVLSRGAIIICLLAFGAAKSVTLNVNGSDTGRTFEGIGAVSAGASSRTLIDYPEPYRSDILDYLFKPKFGAGFQHLKVEIGGGLNSTCGSEPSFAHTRAEFSNPNFKVGYEYWLMRMAKDRNPNEILDGLAWGVPGWVGTTFFSQQNADYLVKFLQGAKSAWNLDIDVIGVWNETLCDLPWARNIFRPTLDNAGFSNVKLYEIAFKMIAFTCLCGTVIPDRVPIIHDQG